jgi:hypothetical protein
MAHRRFFYIWQVRDRSLAKCMARVCEFMHILERDSLGAPLVWIQHTFITMILPRLKSAPFIQAILLS